MQDKINSIESDLELFDEHIEKLEEQKKQLEYVIYFSIVSLVDFDITFMLASVFIMIYF